MRVVFANNYCYLRGGCERVLFDEMSWLQAHRSAPLLFGRARPGDNSRPHSELFPRLVEVEQLGPVGKGRAALNIIYNRRTGNRFKAFLQRTKPDLVHFHNIYAGLTTAVMDACHSLDLPCVLTLHDTKLACPSYLMLNHGRRCKLCLGGKFYHCLMTGCHKNSRAVSLVSTVEAYFNEWLGKYLQADLLIAPSRFVLEQMVAQGIPKWKLRYIANGIDPARYVPSSEERGYVLFFGRLSPEKGVHVLVDAVAGTCLPTRIVGEGPESDRLVMLAQARSASNVSFEGYKTGEELANLVRGATMVVVPSECYENASLTILETMAYGKPVIASRLGGIPEQIIDGQTGLLFEPGNVEQLRELITKLASDHKRRREMERQARARVETEFSLERHCQSLLEVYQEAIRDHGSER